MKKVRLAVKRTVAALAVVGMAVLTTSPALARVEIEFWHAMRGHRGEVLNRMVERFNRENPDIHVTARFIGSSNPRLGNDYNALYRALLEHLARGAPPDVSQVYENWTVQLIDIGAIVPVQDFFEGPEGMSPAEVEDFVPIFREANRFADGRLWTLPFNKSIYVLYYNREIFERLGLRPPETWKELRGAAQAIHEQLGLPGLVFRPNVDHFGHVLYANGGSFIEGGKPAFKGPAAESALQFWVDLVHQDRSALPTFEARKKFQDGQAGMYIETSSKIGGFERKPGLRFGVTLLPRGKTRAYQFAGTNLALYARSTPERQRAAWRFIRYMTSPAATTEWAIQTGYLPVRRSAMEGREYRRYMEEHPDYRVVLKALDYAVVQPRVSAWEAIRGILDDAMFEAISRKSTAREAINRAVAVTDNLLHSLQGNP